MRQIKSIALTVALGVAGVKVAQGRDFGLVSIPDKLKPQPRSEDVYECTAMIPLPKGGNINVYHVYMEGTTDVTDDFYGFSVPDLTERNILSLLASAADQDRLIQLPISGRTWFGCAYARPNDGESVIYEGAVVVEGAYFVVQFHLPPTQPLDREVMDILAQIRLLPGRATKTRKLLDAIQETDGLSDVERRDACKMACVQTPESVELIELLKASAEKVGDAACADWCSRQLVRLNPAICRPRDRWNAKSCRALTLGEHEEIKSGKKAPPPDAMPDWGGFAAKAVALKEVEIPSGAKARSASASAVNLPPLPAVVTAPKAPTVKPLLSDDFMNAATCKAAIAHARESLRELLGPMSDEANAALEKRWNAVADYPAPEILDWLKKVSPILSEQVRLKAAIDTAMVACDDALREAVYAQTFGDAVAEREQMRAYAENLTAMKTAQARMNALQRELDELGEMPDPKELARRDDEARRAALATVRDLLGPGASAPSDVAVGASHSGTKMKPAGRSPAGKTAVATQGHWQRVEKNFEKGKDKIEKDSQWGTVHDNSYSGSELHFQHDYKMDGGDKHERASFNATCSTEPPQKIAGDETLKFGLSLKTTASTYLFCEETVSVFADVPGLGVNYLKSCRRAEEASNPKMDGLKVSAAKDEKKLPRESSGVFKLKMPAGRRDGERICIYFRGCGSQTCWIYEWSTETMPARIAPSTAQAPDAEVALGDFPLADNAPDTPEAKAERIAFHRQNIVFIEGTIARLQKELAAEKDPQRRAALEWQIVCERSNVIYEQDRIRAEETGTFTASRTPFDEMCQVQQRENTRRQILEAERLNRARRRVESLMVKMPAVEWDATDRIIDKINAEDPLDAEQWIKLGDALEKKYTGRLEYAQGMAESDLVDAEDRLLRAEKVKTRCDIALALGGVAGAPGAISLLYQTGTGFVEDGVKGAVKNAACFYCDAIDIACSTYDGYKEDGLTGALKGAVWSTVMNKGVPFLVGKVQGKLNTDVRDLLGSKGKVSASAKVKTGASGKSKADVLNNKEVMAAEVMKAKSEISEFIRVQNEFNQAKLEHMSDRELAKIESDLVKATARVNENPTAKACLKYDDDYKKVGEAFDGTLGKIHETIKTKFYADMKAKGFNDQEIMQIRNASSKGTVGMDADWGLKETPGMVITRNGKRVSVHEWQVEATESWNRMYKKSTGFDAQKSWESQTTHLDPEAYRNMEILEYSKEANNMDEILSKLSVSDAQQAFDVVRYKADVMLNGKDFPRLVYVREAVRGTAKDMKSKLIPALDVKIRALKAKQAALKKGETLSKTDAHNLTRLEAAMAHYESMMKTFDDIGTGKMRSEDWDDAIRTVTGGRGVSDEINDMTDLFKSLVF